MKSVEKEFEEHCQENYIEYERITSVKSYDDTVLFCPAGMQKYKKDFGNPDIKEKTIANIQSCLRLNDYDEMGDGTHCLCFNMIGLFSFRDISLVDAINFWLDFMDRIGVRVDYITIHPDKWDEWSDIYSKNKRISKYPLKKDDECKWSDGKSPESYCTEFYHIRDDVEIEIGNIVNSQNGSCIDAGFGLERLDTIANNTTKLATKKDLIFEAINKIVDSGYKPDNKKHGYVLRRLYRDYIKSGFDIDNKVYEYYLSEKERLKKLNDKYHRLKKKHSDKPKEYWLSTFGIDLDEVDNKGE